MKVLAVKFLKGIQGILSIGRNVNTFHQNNRSEEARVHRGANQNLEDSNVM